MKKTFSASLLSLSIFFVMGAALVLAQGGGAGTPGSGGVGNPGSPGGGTNISIPNPFNDKVGNSLFTLMRTIVNDIILPVGGVLAVLAFIYSGFLYVTAQGKEAQIATAHKALLYTSIGTAVLLGSWVLANVICQTIGQLGGPICPPR